MTWFYGIWQGRRCFGWWWEMKFEDTIHPPEVLCRIVPLSQLSSWSDRSVIFHWFDGHYPIVEPVALFKGETKMLWIKLLDAFFASFHYGINSRVNSCYVDKSLFIPSDTPISVDSRRLLQVLRSLWILIVVDFSLLLQPTPVTALQRTFTLDDLVSLYWSQV